MKMRKLLALLLALIMSLSLVACGGSDDEAAADEGEDAATEEVATTDTLVVLSSGAFQGTWDPTGNTILSNKHLEWVVFDHLVRKDADGNKTADSEKYTAFREAYWKHRAAAYDAGS